MALVRAKRPGEFHASVQYWRQLPIFFALRIMVGEPCPAQFRVTVGRFFSSTECASPRALAGGAWCQQHGNNLLAKRQQCIK